MKHLVETTGEFLLHDMNTGDLAESFRPSVVTRSVFIDQRIAAGQLRLIANLKEEASDEEFHSYWREAGDKELAVSSFLSKFGADAEHASDEPKKRGRK